MSIFVCAQVVWPWGSALSAAEAPGDTGTKPGPHFGGAGGEWPVCHAVPREGALQQAPHSEAQSWTIPGPSLPGLQGARGRAGKKRGQKQSRDKKQGGVSVHNSGFIASCEFLVEAFQKQNREYYLWSIYYL